MVRPGSTFIACAFALMVLGLFFLLQDAGPESTVRRYNEDMRSLYLEDSASLTLENANSYSAVQLRQLVGGYFASRANYKVVAVRRSTNKVIAVTLYTFPNGAQVPMIWVVYYHQRIWQISAGETLRRTEIEFGQR